MFTFAASRNVNSSIYIAHVESYNNPGIPGLTDGSVTGHGIVLGQVNNALIERCVFHDNGTQGNGGAGIFTYDSNAVTFQYNESHHNHTAGGQDGDGFDLDRNVGNSVMQYNYSHDNDGGGYLLSHHDDNFVHTNNIVRYNISQNDGRKNGYGGIHLWGRVLNAEIYGNTVYMTLPSSGTHAPVRIRNTGLLITQDPQHVHFRNNVFQTTGGLALIDITSDALNGSVDVTFQNNAYWSSGSGFKIVWGGTTYTGFSSWTSATGREKVNGVVVGVNSDPQYTSPGQGGTIGNADNLANLTAYKLLSTSPLINKGQTLSNTGGKDFWGNPAPQKSAFDIGANESPYDTPGGGGGGPFVAHINFQDATSGGFAGYLADLGNTYASRNGLTYGWTTDDTANARNKNLALSPDERYDTFNHMQKNGINYTWEIAVPNGTYQVHIAAGDAGYLDGTFKINAEGVLCVNGTPTSANHWVEGTVICTVSDGKLTITNASGAVGNKICYIDITQQVSGSAMAAALPGSGGTVDGSIFASTPISARESNAVLDTEHSYSHFA